VRELARAAPTALERLFKRLPALSLDARERGARGRIEITDGLHSPRLAWSDTMTDSVWRGAIPNQVEVQMADIQDRQKAEGQSSDWKTDD